jgi:hypothetical protein
MYIHLKEREHYEESYDKWTVDRCRHFASYDPDLTDEDLAKEKLTSEQVEAMKTVKGLWSNVIREMTTFSYAAERYNGKEAYISQQIREDREKDERLARIRQPTSIRCRECLATTGLKLISTDEWHSSAKVEQLLFMYECSHCNTRTAYFDNGEQYYPEPTLCPECRRDESTFSRKKTKNKLTIVYTCSYCSHTWDEVLDFTPKKEGHDPNYLTDRKLYCYSDKVRRQAADIIRTGPLLKSSTNPKEHIKREKVKADLDAIDKLTIAQVSRLLTVNLAKDGYTDMTKQVMVPFTVMDNEDRQENKSRQGLYKLISELLNDANWRLVRTSLTYRLGYLSGRLKAYETDADLIALLAQKKK